jgi:hypothetical protein
MVARSVTRTAAIVIVAALAAATLAVVVQLRRAELAVADGPPAPSRPASITETIAASPAARAANASTSCARARSATPAATDRPMIANVAVDLDADGLADIVAADAATNRVTWARQAPVGRFTERTLAEVPGPAHARRRPRWTAISIPPSPASGCFSPTTRGSARSAGERRQ